MKIHLDLRRAAFSFERKPMPDRRFHVLCLLAAGGMYGGLVIGVLKLCGLFGMLWLFLFTGIMTGVGAYIYYNLL